MKYLWVVLLAFIVSPALAQEAAEAPAPAEPASVADVAPAPAEPAILAPAAVVDPAAVPAVTPAAATAQAPAATLQPVQNNFPPLPPSRPCARPDVDGLWKLTNVYEYPPSAETSDFANNPHQYVLFQRDDTYRTYKSTWGDKSDGQVRKEMMLTPPDYLQQYVVDQTGFLYFYVNGEATYALACFIVANRVAPFSEGQMLLMPPEGQSPTRLVRVYEAISGAAPATAPTKSNAKKNHKKKRRKRR